MAARALAGVTPADRLTVGHYMMRRWSLADDVRGLERLGFRSISLAGSKLTAFGIRKAVRLLRSSSLQVAHMGSWGFFGTTRATAAKGVEDVRRALGWAHELDADVLVVLTGSRGAEPWERAARVFRDCYARLLPDAAAAGVKLAVEVVHPLRQDLSFVNTIGDAGRLVRAAGRRGGWLLDLWHSGWEPTVLETIRRDAARRITAVQISDYKKVTTRSLDRALLGKGVLPLRAIFAALERGGYRGWYEIEIISDDVDRIGYDRVLRETRRTFTRLMEHA
jgi:sugar phosphate isomerase/epimerase